MPVGEVIPVAIKGDNVVVPIKASSKRNYLPTEECSTISNSSISSDGISELFSDNLSWTGNWSDSEEEQECDLEEDEIPPGPAASVNIELSASVAPTVHIIKSFEEYRWEHWVSKVSTKLIEATKSDCKPDVVAGYLVQCALKPRVLPGYGDPKTLPRLSKVQRVIIKKVAEEYGYLYAYIPAQLEEEIQDKETQWIKFPSDPSAGGLPKVVPKIAKKYLSVLHTWGYDRKLNLNSVIIHRPNKADIQH